MHKELKDQMHPILEEMDQSLPEGEIPAGIFNDPEIFELRRRMEAGQTGRDPGQRYPAHHEYIVLLLRGRYG